MTAFARTLRALAAEIRNELWTARIRTILKWCMPAVFVAIILQVCVLHHFPSAFVHNDTAAAVSTPEMFFGEGILSIDSKKTFLVPLIYCVPVAFGVPILFGVSLIQSFVQIGIVLLTGLLCGAWMKYWRCWILPVTLVTACNPVLIWYGHTALAEIYSVSGLLALALTGTFLFRKRSRVALGLFLLAVLFVAGARPEGYLACGFALALVARTFWWNRAVRFRAVGFTLGWCVMVVAVTRTGQSGTLLLASVVHLSPETLFFSPPNLRAAIEPSRVLAVDSWDDPHGPALVSVRKTLELAIVEAGVEAGLATEDAVASRNRVAKLAGIEIAARNFRVLPELALRKFVVAHREFAAPGFNSYADKGQIEVLFRPDESPKRAFNQSQMLWGRQFTRRGDAIDFLEQSFAPLPRAWLDEWLSIFSRACLVSIFPVALPGADKAGVPIDGLPWLYAVAVAGMICLVIRDDSPPGFQWIWVAFVVCFFIVILVTANVRARFRVSFEPFWFIYAAAFFDSVVVMAIGRLRRFQKQETY